jgi:hypothetical protein
MAWYFGSLGQRPVERRGDISAATLAAVESRLRILLEL